MKQVLKEIKVLLPHGGIVLLRGDLASGKTTLVKEFVKFLGIKDDVSSPTFSVLNIYDERVYHYDIYNEGTKKFLQNGMLENLELEGYHLIEWADKDLEKIIKECGFKYIVIQIDVLHERREYKVIHDT